MILKDHKEIYNLAIHNSGYKNELKYVETKPKKQTNKLTITGIIIQNIIELRI